MEISNGYHSYALYHAVAAVKETNQPDFSQMTLKEGKSESGILGIGLLRVPGTDMSYGISARYAEDSTEEEPVIRVKVQTASGPQDYDIHVKDVDPANATEIEMFALCNYVDDKGKGTGSTFGSWQTLNYYRNNAVYNGEFGESNTTEAFCTMRLDWTKMVQTMMKNYQEAGIYVQALQGQSLLSVLALFPDQKEKDKQAVGGDVQSTQSIVYEANRTARPAVNESDGTARSAADESAEAVQAAVKDSQITEKALEDAKRNAAASVYQMAAEECGETDKSNGIEKHSSDYYHEQAFNMVGSKAPETVKQAWMEAAREVGVNGMGIGANGMWTHISQMMVQRILNQSNGREADNVLGSTVESAMLAVGEALYNLEHPLAPYTPKSPQVKEAVEKEKEFYLVFLEKLKGIS